MACLTQTWESTYSEQCEYISNLLAVLQPIDESTQAIVLYQSTEPTPAELIAAWEEQTGSTNAPSVGSTFYWFDPDTEAIENVFLPVDDVADGVSTGTPISYYEKDRSLDWVYLDSVLNAEADGGTTLSISGIDQTYKHLFFTFSARLVDAAVSVAAGLRLNGVSTANYHVGRINYDAAAVVGTGVTGQSSLIDEAITPAAGTTFQVSSSMLGYGLIPNYALADVDKYAGVMPYTRKLGFIGTAPITTANRNLSQAWAACIAATFHPVTQISWVSTTNWRRGSQMTLYGLK
jgi:hypothetical protein